MTQPDESDHVSAKDMKRRQKRAWKKEKLAAKSTRREEKLQRKIALRAARKVITYKSRLPRAGAVALMEEILAGLKAGRIDIEHDDEKLDITPSEQVRVRVRARQTHKSEGILIRVSWPRSTTFEPSPSVTISPGKGEETGA